MTTFNGTKDRRRSPQVEEDLEELGIRAKPKRGSSSRKAKVARGAKPTPDLHEVAVVEEKLNKFIPTQKQKAMIRKIESNTITFVDSVAGVGKSATALYWMCQQYLRNPLINIVITRTPVEVGADKIGFLPSTLEEKCAVHFASAKVLLEEFLGKAKVEADLGKRIHFTIPNYALGMTMKNTLWLIDETQQLQPIILKLLLERIGEGTKVIVAGCSSQIYTTDRNRNALADGMKRFFNANGSAKYKGFALQSFTVDDCMRSDIVKDVIRAYEEDK